MMKFKKFLLFFLIVGLTVSLNSLWGKELKGILLEEVLSIGRLDDDVLFMWAGVTTDLKGNIYVTDTMDYSVKKFNERGILVKKTGRKGQGPGEFLVVRLIEYFEGLVYVTDQSISGIQVFDEDLNYKKHIPLSLPILDLKIISKEMIALSSPQIANPGRIIVIDSKGNSKVNLKYLNDMHNFWRNAVKFEIDSQGNLYLIFAFEDRIEKYDRNKKKLWSKNLLGKKKVRRKKLKAKFGPSELPMEVAYKDIALDNSENIIILGGHLSKNPSRDVYVLNKQGRQLTTFTLPETSHCIHIDHRNFLYARAGEGVTLKKYSMKYVKK
jgi:hypothetical protein